MSRYQGLIAESMAYPGFQGTQVESFLARPIGPGTFPAVVIAHHIRGWDHFVKESACRLASEGFVVVSPNFFTREAPGADPDTASMAVKQQGGVPDDQAVGDTAGALQWLRSRAYVNGRIGIIGWCLGGRQAFLAACQESLDAAVNIYGGSITTEFGGGRFCIVGPEEIHRKHPIIPIALTPNLSCPMLMLTGSLDRVISADMLKETTETLDQYHKRYQSYVLDRAGHEFMNPYTTEYRVEAAMESWSRAIAFLHDELDIKQGEASR